jgi:hypothetical protein
MVFLSSLFKNMTSCNQCGKSKSKTRKGGMKGGCGCSGGLKFGGSMRKTKHYRIKKGRKSRSRRYLGGGYLNPATFSDSVPVDSYYQPFSKIIGTSADVTDPGNIVDTRLQPQTGGQYQELSHLGEENVLDYNKHLPSKMNQSIVGGSHRRKHRH